MWFGLLPQPVSPSPFPTDLTAFLPILPTSCQSLPCSNSLPGFLTGLQCFSEATVQSSCLDSPYIAPLHTAGWDRGVQSVSDLPVSLWHGALASFNGTVSPDQLPPSPSLASWRSVLLTSDLGGWTVVRAHDQWVRGMVLKEIFQIDKDPR